MIVRYSFQIWFGDKPSVVESLGEVKSIINVAHKIRRPYHQDLHKLKGDAWYFWMGCPDGKDPGTEYFEALGHIVDAIRADDRFPVLCHCRTGNHRGPSAALFTQWHLQGRTGLAALIEGMKIHLPDFEKHKERRVYRQTLLRYCEENSAD